MEVDVQRQNIGVDIVVDALWQGAAVRGGVGGHGRGALGAQLGHRGIVVVVEIVQRGRVGVDVDFIVVQVEVQHFNIAAAALKAGLIVGADLVDRPIIDAILVVVKDRRFIGRAVVVAVEHRNDVGILGDHIVLYQLAVVVHQATVAVVGHAGVGVEAEDSLAVTVFLQHTVHPVYFIRVDVPAHIQDDKVLAVLGQQVIMADVVLVGLAEGRLILHALCAEVFLVVLVLHRARGNVMVAGQHAVGHVGVIQNLHRLVGVLPLIRHVEVIDNIAGVDDIADVQLVLVAHDPVVHVQVMLEELLGVILGVGLPGKGKVVISGNRRAVPGSCGGLVGHAAEIRQRGVCRALHHDRGRAVLHVVFDRDADRHRAVLVGGGGLIPGAGGGVLHKQPAGVGRIGV